MNAAIMPATVVADDWIAPSTGSGGRKGGNVAEFSSALLKQAMHLSGLTAGELARRVGLHRVSLARYTNAVSCPPETWAKIERALRLALAERAKECERLGKKLS